MILKIGMAQFSPVLGDVSKNLETILDFVSKAESEGCGLVTFPENALTGYFLRDLATEVAQPVDSNILGEIKSRSRKIDILLGYVEKSHNLNCYIAAGYFSSGEIVHVHRKVYLPTYGMFEDQRYFAHGDRVRAFDTSYTRMGMLICEDAIHPLMLYTLAMDGACIVNVISNSPLRGLLKNETDTLEKWEETLRFYSRIYGLYVVYTNRSGFEDGIHFGGNSFISDPVGEIVTRGKKGEDDFLTQTISVEEISRARTRLPLVRDELIPLAIKELERIYIEKE
jgi:predicted amidohydrolase